MKNHGREKPEPTKIKHSYSQICSMIMSVVIVKDVSVDFPRGGETNIDLVDKLKIDFHDRPGNHPNHRHMTSRDAPESPGGRPDLAQFV